MNYKLLLEIILVFMKIDILSFGGGYVAIPIVEKQIVKIKGWMDYKEFMNILAIDELTPGPIAINASTFIGNKMYGVLGGIIATLGNIIPSIIISLILVKIYLKYKDTNFFKGILKGIKCMVIGLLFSTLLSLLINSTIQNNTFGILSVILITLSTFVIRKFKTSPILVILSSGMFYLIINLLL